MFFNHRYEDIISLENLLAAWEEFVVGKRSRQDVQEFGSNLMHNIISLYRDLAAKTYAMAYQVSHNHTRTCWVLKCDIRKFFASIDHCILIGVLQQYITDQDVLWLLGEVIVSFHSGISGIGLPLGNLTSQLFANIYLNELDQFVKHRLKARHYIRYADDFVLLSEDREWLEHQLPHLQQFLKDRLCLTLHPDKVFITTVASGIDFLGWVHFSDHRVLRSASRRRMLRRIDEHPTEPTLQSYLGLLSHGNTEHVRWDVLQRAGLFHNFD